MVEAENGCGRPPPPPEMSYSLNQDLTGPSPNHHTHPLTCSFGVVMWELWTGGPGMPRRGRWGARGAVLGV